MSDRKFCIEILVYLFQDNCASIMHDCSRPTSRQKTVPSLVCSSFLLAIICHLMIGLVYSLTTTSLPGALTYLLTNLLTHYRDR